MSEPDRQTNDDCDVEKNTLDALRRIGDKLSGIETGIWVIIFIAITALVLHR